jgi:hypothetical protein
LSRADFQSSLLFNIFINDIFYFIEHGTLYNYADDNTLSYADQDYNTLINVLEKESSIFSCIFSSFIVFAFEQKCQAKGQKLKLDNIKE